jgi:hypothetical protein
VSRERNVLLDIATADVTWLGWWQAWLTAAAGRGAAFINAVARHYQRTF